MAKIKTITLVVLGLAFGAHHAGSASVVRDSLRIELQVVYTSQIGVREATGRNDGPQVEAYLKSTQMKRGAPWCAAFVTWCFDQVGIRNAKSAWSPAWFPRSNTIWRNATGGMTPTTGDVFGIYYSNLKRIGHVGFVDKWSGNWVITVEGNTNDALSREGDGVYKRRRNIRQIHSVSRWIN